MKLLICILNCTLFIPLLYSQNINLKENIKEFKRDTILSNKGKDTSIVWGDTTLNILAIDKVKNKDSVALNANYVKSIEVKLKRSNFLNGVSLGVQFEGFIPGIVVPTVVGMNFSSPYLLNTVALNAQMLLGYIPNFVDNYTLQGHNYISGGGVGVRFNLKKWTWKNITNNNHPLSTIRIFFDNNLGFITQQKEAMFIPLFYIKHELGTEFSINETSSWVISYSLLGKGTHINTIGYQDFLFSWSFGYKVYPKNVTNFFMNVLKSAVAVPIAVLSGGAWVPFFGKELRNQKIKNATQTSQ